MSFAQSATLAVVRLIKADTWPIKDVFVEFPEDMVPRMTQARVSERHGQRSSAHGVRHDSIIRLNGAEMYDVVQVEKIAFSMAHGVDLTRVSNSDYPSSQEGYIKAIITQTRDGE